MREAYESGSPAPQGANTGSRSDGGRFADADDRQRLTKAFDTAASATAYREETSRRL